jgi:hypothetical protein
MEAGGSLFSLSNLNLSFPVTSKLSCPADCPSVGIASIPRDSSLTTQDREAAFQSSVANNGRLLDVDATWAELEPRPGEFHLERIADELALGQKYGYRISFTLKIVDNVANGLPPDLAGLAWDDARVTTRLSALVDRVLRVLPARVEWINLGYEVEGYLGARPAEVGPFGRLVAAGKSRVRQQRPSLSVGVDFAFDSTRTGNAIFQALKPLCDHIAFDYYAQANQFTQRSPASPLSDVPLMIHFAEGRPIVLKEVGYSSGAASGASEEAQNTFFSNLFQALRNASGQVVGANVWAIQDMPAGMVESVMRSYGMGANPAAESFLGTLGLNTTNAVPKPAWQTVTSAMSQFSARSACLTPQIRE